MDLRAGLFQQQSLKLAMTKELTQAITLLQYSSLELQDFLHQQSLENPLIDFKIRPHTSTIRSNKIAKNPIDYIGHNETSLSDHLYLQLVDFDLCPEDRRVVNYIIDSLDNNGYLLTAENEIALAIGVNINKVTKAISIIHQLEPTGVGARSLQECLLLQLNQIPNQCPLATIVIAQYFESFANKSWKEIASALKIQVKEVQAIYDYVQQLNPRPGSQFHSNTTSYIKPDVKVEIEKGEILVSLLEEYCPKLSLNKQYYQLKDTNPEAKVYLESKYNQYLWIQKSIEQRKQTILKVMAAITRKQSSFFTRGPVFLEPLTMNDVAKELEIHESTVSRASKGKYVQTPYGTYEIKSFFSNQVNDKSPDDISSTQVKNVLKELINKENKLKPLSDQKLVSLLEQDHQIVVSRRTIAKYRDQLGIQGSSKRKRY
jgi:RNA polymerase sigma-54 factor